MTDINQHSHKDIEEVRKSWSSREYLDSLVEYESTVRLDKDVIVFMERTSLYSVGIILIHFYNDKNKPRNIPEGFQIHNDLKNEFVQPSKYNKKIFVIGYTYDYTIYYKSKKIVELNHDNGQWTLNNLEYNMDNYE